MKKYGVFIIILFSIISFSYVVGVYNNPPLSYKEKGEIKGIYPEVLNEIAKREG